MMSEENMHTIYLERARLAKAEAEGAKDPEVRAELIKIATMWERLGRRTAGLPDASASSGTTPTYGSGAN